MNGRWILGAGLLLGHSLAAQDTTQAKASLMAADRAAATSGAALAAALSADASVLVPGRHVLEGRRSWAGVVASLTASPAGLPAWSPVHAVVSRAGDFGCTTGILHLPAGDSASARTGRYANCWQWSRGRWRLVAHARSTAPPAVASLPESLPGAPGSTGAAARRRGAARAMNAADRAFASFSVDSGGPGGAFARWIAADGMMLGARAIPVRGPDQARQAFGGFPATGRLEWGPIDRLARASRDGALGFTIGEARSAATPAEVTYSKYLTIWRREPDGAYRFVFDIGSDRPAPPK
jgi:ketosteroid isomerase-like protein